MSMYGTACSFFRKRSLHSALPRFVRISIGASCFLAFSLFAQTVETVKVVSKPVSRSIKLPGELLPFESVEVFARVSGFVDSIRVDRGSVVKKGDLLAEISAPELKAQRAEAHSKAEALKAQQNEAALRVSTEQATLARMQEAAKTPGAIAQNDIDVARKNIEAAQAGLRAIG